MEGKRDSGTSTKDYLKDINQFGQLGREAEEVKCTRLVSLMHPA